MITPKTQAAIAVLKNIYAETDGTDECSLSENEKRELLEKFATVGIISLADKESPQTPAAYKPARKSVDVSLLDILEVTGEHLNCNRPTTEEFYLKYGNAAKKLGVVNQITRTYLKEIKLFDL